MADILRFTGTTINDGLSEDALETAKGWGMERCVIIGFDQDNKLKFGGSTSDIAQIVMLLELAKARIIELAKED